MKGTLANKGRCPVCTLKPPCKHYETMEQLLGSAMTQDTNHPQATPDRQLFYPDQASGVSVSMASEVKH